VADEQARAGQDAIERRLVQLGRAIAYPPTPDIAGSVHRQLTAGKPPRSPWWMVTLPLRRTLAYAIVAVVVFLGVLLAAWPPARTAVADRLGLRGVAIEQRLSPALPTAVALSRETWEDLGERVTIDEARARASFPVLLPSSNALGMPEEVHFDPSVPGGQVALVYGARPGIPATEDRSIGLLLFEFRSPPGAVNEGIFRKQLAAGTRIEPVQVNSGRGLWIEGAPHILYLLDERGGVRTETVRLAGNVLLWERGEVTLRLEGALSKEVALRIATSVG
jgi:hypothetical protein